jgi:hypothetical protein
LDGQRLALQGAKMVKDFSTLMLRAYNAEADNCVRTVKPHIVRTVRLRLDAAGYRQAGSHERHQMLPALSAAHRRFGDRRQVRRGNPRVRGSIPGDP